MDSSSFELTLKPCRIYIPKVWSSFLKYLSDIHDLPKKLVVVRNYKFKLEREAALLVGSGSGSFTFSTAFLKNMIKALEEEDKFIEEEMKKVRPPIIYVDLSKNTKAEREGNMQGRRSVNCSHDKNKGKQVVENPSPRRRLLFRSSKAGSSRPGNHSRHVVTPVPRPSPAPAPAPARQPSLHPTRASRLGKSRFGLLEK